MYGRHEIKDCYWNNLESAKMVLEVRKAIASGKLGAILPKYKINKIIGQYQSGLEDTFLWILDAEDPRLIEQFAVDTKTAKLQWAQNSSTCNIPKCCRRST